MATLTAFIHSTAVRAAAERRQGRWRRTLAAIGFSAFVFLPVWADAAPQPATVAPPSALYGELFVEVQMNKVFEDGKTFVDATPKHAPQEILERYRKAKQAPDFVLADFVRSHFEAPTSAGSGFVADAARSVEAHIEALWPFLTRPADTQRQAVGSSLLPLPHPYVVPGGRFREIYYWDSYFTMLGLMDGGQSALAENMVKNFAYLIDHYGHVPNGNRSYFLSRSQPPFFYKMVEALAPQTPGASFARYLPQLRQEYAYWMRGAERLKPKHGRAHAEQHVVLMPDGSILNRYWDARDVPRDESYREDVLTAQESKRPVAQVYRDLRAGAESGWDYSARWFADGKSLSTIETTSIVPVDLNSLLYGLELAISQGCAQTKDMPCHSTFADKAAERKRAVNRYLWNEGEARYADYQWVEGHQTDRASAATLYPLFVGMSDAAQARKVAQWTSVHLLNKNGIAPTEVRSGQQWDVPNGWAPHQWVAIDGFNRYGHTELGKDIATRWMRTVDTVYRASGKLVEKYDVVEDKPAGGGEYATQDGFGWTNGVMVRLMKQYPDAIRSAQP